jgi:hypothetical protein
LRFDERFQPTENNLDTGPASLRRADLTLRGASRVVADYWDLVYSASRHNCGVRYWVVLDPPARIEGIEAPVRAVEFVALEEPPCTAPGQFLPPQARYLGEGFEVLAAPAVTGYRRAPVDEPGGAAFRRGDADGTGGVNLTDAVFLLTYLFLEGPAPGCLESADGDDNGVLNLTDGLYLLNYLFLDGEAPPEPFAACGPDPSPDALGCASFRSCN